MPFLATENKATLRGAWTPITITTPPLYAALSWSLDSEISTMWPRKRKRPLWKNTAVVGLQCLVIGVGWQRGEAQYADCLTSFLQNDMNRDSILSADDYERLIFDMTQEKLVLDMGSSARTVVHQAFDVRLDADLGGINIAAAAPSTPVANQQGVQLFCENIYESLFAAFEVSVEGNVCRTNLSNYTATDGTINATDFVELTSELSGEPFSSYEDLGNATQQVFDDFAGLGGVISESLLTSNTRLEDLFCGRIVLGTQLDGDALPSLNVTDSGNSTGFPSAAPTSQQPSALNATFAPTEDTPAGNNTLSPSNINGTLVPTPSPSLDGPTAPTSPPTISAEAYEACKLSMLLSDRNRDDLLQNEEWITFLNRQTDNSFPGETFQTLDLLFLTLYDTLRGDDTFPSVLGSKPGASPTADETANLVQICGETDRVYREYLELIQNRPTSLPTSSPTQSPLSEGAIPESEFSQCKLFLFVSDSNRNSQLDQNEFTSFVNRLTVNAFLGRPYIELPSMFQDVFQASTGTSGFISIVGSRNGQPATAEQLEALKNTCTRAYQARTLWEETKTESPTISPAAPPNGIAPTLAPTIPTSDFVLCTTSLAVSDSNRDEFLAQTEYVTFINRLTGNRFQNLSFLSLDSRLQASFIANRETSGNTINIGGARPGPRTEAQRRFLLQFCSETDRIIKSLDQPITPSAPTIAPTSRPSESLTVQELAQCQAFAAVSDSDRDRLLNPVEFVRFVNELTEGAFVQSTFDDLDSLFQEAFKQSQTDSGFINITGSRPGEITSPDQEARLKDFCSLVFLALDDFKSRPPPTSAPTAGDPLDDPGVLSCITTLDVFDLNRDGSLDQVEYVSLISELSLGAFAFDALFELLPYVLRDNFLWISGETALIDISGAQNTSQINEQSDTVQIRRLARLCQRSVAVVSSALGGNIEVFLFDHCYGAMTFADSDRDNALNATEFARMVLYFQGLENSIVPYLSLDEPYRRVFDENKGLSTGTVAVDGSKPEQNPTPGQSILLEYLCGEIEASNNEARLNFQDRIQCSDALFEANADSNDVLSPQEYLSFVYAFAGRPRGLGTFDDLPSELQLNFEILSSPGTSTINIIGWQGRQSSDLERENLNRVCNATSTAILNGFSDSETAPTAAPGEIVTATVYNGFVLSSNAGLKLVDLRNTDVVALETAYAAFINATITPLLVGRLLRGRRKLSAFSLSYESIGVDQILDGSCFDADISDSSVCLEAYASFDVILLPDGDIDAVVTEYTELTQSAISNGLLQEQVEIVNPESRFEVVGISGFTRPQTQTPTLSPGGTPVPSTRDVPTPSPVENDPNDSEDEDSTMTIIIIILAVAIALCCCGCGMAGCYFIYKQRIKQSVDNAMDAPKKEKEKQPFSADLYNPPPKGPSPQQSDSKMDRINNIMEPSSTLEDENPWDRPAPDSPTSNDDDDNPWGDAPSPNPSSRHDDNVLSSPRVETIGESSDESDFSGSMGDSSSSSADNEVEDDNIEIVDAEQKEFIAKERSEEENFGDSIKEIEKSEGNSDPNLFQNPYTVSKVAKEEDEEEMSLADTIDASYMSMTDEQRHAQAVYREEVKRLVALVVPDEIENVDVMMEQFFGREEELISTLRGMAEDANQGLAKEEGSYGSDYSDGFDSVEEESDQSGSSSSFDEQSFDDDEDSYGEEEVVEESFHDSDSFEEESIEEELEETVNDDTINDDVMYASFTVADDEGMEEYYNKSFNMPNPYEMGDNSASYDSEYEEETVED